MSFSIVDVAVMFFHLGQCKNCLIELNKCILCGIMVGFNVEDVDPVSRLAFKRNSFGLPSVTSVMLVTPSINERGVCRKQGSRFLVRC